MPKYVIERETPRSGTNSAGTIESYFANLVWRTKQPGTANSVGA
jgi:hypothetical protein